MLIKSTVLLMSLLLTASCARNETIEKCVAASDVSTFSNDHYKVYLYGPNDAVEPDIWEGPVCIERRSIGGACELDISLIKGVIFNAERELKILTFSGSNESVIRIDIEKCTIK